MHDQHCSGSGCQPHGEEPIADRQSAPLDVDMLTLVFAVSPRLNDDGPRIDLVGIDQGYPDCLLCDPRNQRAHILR